MILVGMLANSKKKLLLPIKWTEYLDVGHHQKLQPAMQANL